MKLLAELQIAFIITHVNTNIHSGVAMLVHDAVGFATVQTVI